MARRIGIANGSYDTTLPSSVFTYAFPTSLELDMPKVLVPMDELESRYPSLVNLGTLRDTSIKMSGLATPTKSMTQILASFLASSTSEIDVGVRWIHTFTPKTSTSTLNALKVFFDVDNFKRRGSPFVVRNFTFEAKAKELPTISVDMIGLLSSDSTTPTITSDSGNVLTKMSESGWLAFKLSISPNDDHAYLLDQNASMRWGAYDLDIEVETMNTTYLNNALNNTTTNLTFTFIGSTLGTFNYAMRFNLNNCILNLVSTTKSKEMELYKFKVIPSTWSIECHNNSNSV